MSVSETERVDAVLGKDGKTILAMFQTRPWDGSPGQRDDVRKKIVAYLGYLRSDEFRERFGDPAKAAIMLTASSEPPKEIQDLLANAAASSGIEIYFQKTPG
jgi:hypothetical protein